MENPERDIVKVLANLVSTDPNRVIKEVQRVYTEDSVMIVVSTFFCHTCYASIHMMHSSARGSLYEWEDPFFIWMGRDTISEVYRFFSLVNRRFDNLRVIDASFNPQHGRVWVDLSVEFQPLVYPLKQTARLLVLYDLVKVDTQGGRALWQIRRQEDLWLPESIVAAVVPEPFGAFAGWLVAFALLIAGMFAAYVLSPITGVASFVLRTLVWRNRTPSPGWTGPLVEVEKEAPTLIKAILNTDTQHVMTVVDRTFAEEAEFDHPLAKFVGSHMIKHLYITWSQAAWLFKNHTVNHVTTNEKKDRLYLDVVYSAYPYVYLLPASARIVVILHLKAVQQKGASQKAYQITRQQDFIQPSRLISAMISGPPGQFLLTAARVLQCVIGTSIARLILPVVNLFLSFLKLLFDY